MKLKFKDGTILEVEDCEGKTKEEIIAEAKTVYKDFKDSQEVETKDLNVPEEQKKEILDTFRENFKKFLIDNDIYGIIEIVGEDLKNVIKEEFNQVTANVDGAQFNDAQEDASCEDAPCEETPTEDTKVEDDETHLTWKELNDIIDQHNKENGIKQQYSDKNPLNCVVVFTQDSFDKEYPVESRSYEFTSDNKYFLPEMGGKSIFAHCLDDSEDIRLDWYLNDWNIEYCYIK